MDTHICTSCGGESKSEGRCMACIMADYEDDCDGCDDHEGEFDDCALMPDGQCLKAGSEECDWECGRWRLL